MVALWQSSVEVLLRCANAAVVDGHADVRARAVMTDDNDDDANVGNLDGTLS